MKTQSYGALKQISTVLTDTADLNVQIGGHTDSDGDAAALATWRSLAIEEGLSDAEIIELMTAMMPALASSTARSGWPSVLDRQPPRPRPDRPSVSTGGSRD